MKHSILTALFCASAISLFAQGTTFTYQGHLADGTGNANGTYDLTFSVWNSSTGPSQIGATITNPTVTVSNGLFTVALDFGAGTFTGADRWLEIGVRTNGGGAYDGLSPRQKISTTPYAMTAGIVTGVLPNGGLSGTYSSPVTLNNAGNSFTGNGSGLTSINAATLGGLTANQLWRTTGNSGTTPTVNFLGTTDNQALEMRVNNGRALRLQPNSGAGASVIAGPNLVDANSPAAVIAGGESNRIAAFAAQTVVSGGFSNQILGASPNANIGGGRLNLILANCFYATIGGGAQNRIEDSAQQVNIAGGLENRISTNANASTICGGWQNVIQQSVASSVIAGGNTNNLGPLVFAAGIGGGYQNVILNGADYAAIGGGRNNRIRTNAQYSVIAGGAFNVIEEGADSAGIGSGFGSTVRSNASSAFIAGGGGHEIRSVSGFVGGGYNNIIEEAAENSAIGGGTANKIGINANSSTISGGTLNRIERGASFSTIGGGSSNKGNTNSVYATIAGGSNNQIDHDADHAAIGGGQLNTVAASAGRAVIAGGDGNIAGGVSSAIGGGTLNLIDAGSTYAVIAGGGGNHVAANSFSSTIAGGYSNNVAGNFSMAAGFRAEANHAGTFAWAGGNTMPYQSIFPNSFNIYASNGISMDYSAQSPGFPRGARFVYIGPFNAGDTIRVWNGAHLTDGGIWSNASDKNRKTDFEEVNTRGVLDKLAALPVRQWRYTNEDAGVKHLGPTAQDFQAAFGLGTDDKSIGTVDADGVALAAIQALNRKVEERNVEIQQLKQRLEHLERLLATEREPKR